MSVTFGMIDSEQQVQVDKTASKPSKATIKESVSVVSNKVNVFAQFIGKHSDIISVVKPFKQGGALRIELSDKIEKEEWRALAYGNKHVYTSAFRGTFTHYLRANMVDASVELLKTAGVKIPRCAYKGKGESK